MTTTRGSVDHGDNHQSQTNNESNNNKYNGDSSLDNMEQITFENNNNQNRGRRKRRSSLPMLPSLLGRVFGSKTSQNENDDNESKTNETNDETSQNGVTNEQKQLEKENLKLSRKIVFYKDQVNKYREKITKLQKDVDEKSEILKEKENVILEKENLLQEKKNKILQLDDRMKRKIQDLQSLIRGRDKRISVLQEKLDKAISNQPKHKRKQTPGGYNMPGISDFINKEDEPTTPLREPLNDGDEDEEDDNDENSNKNNKNNNYKNEFTLEDKIKQRPEWKEVQSRGIISYDPTTKLSHETQEMSRVLRKRRASKNVEMSLNQRPEKEDLIKSNIMLGDNETIESRKQEKEKIKQDINEQLSSIKKNPNGYIDTNNDNNNTINENEEYTDNSSRFGQFNYNQEKPNPSPLNKTDFKNLDRKIRQRPSIHETLSRGILYDRPDTKLDHSILDRKKILHRRRASKHIENFLSKRPSPQEMKQRNILKSKEELRTQMSHKRQISQQLDTSIRRRPSISELNNKGISIALLFTGNGIVPIIGQSGNRDSEEEKYDEDDNIFNRSNRNDISNYFNNNNNKYKGYTYETFTENNTTYQFYRTFEPYKLNKKNKIKRINRELSQRSNIKELITKGILYQHPSLTPNLYKRQKFREYINARYKIQQTLSTRSTINELKAKNIYIEVEQRTNQKKHKRKLSQDLEQKLVSRPSPNQLQEQGIAFLDFGGLLIPFVINKPVPQNNNNDNNNNNNNINSNNSININSTSNNNYDQRTNDTINNRNHNNGIISDDDNDNKIEDSDSDMDNNYQHKKLIEKNEELERELNQQKFYIDQLSGESDLKDTKMKELHSEISKLSQQLALHKLSNNNNDNNNTNFNNNDIELLQKQLQQTNKELNSRDEYIDRLKFEFKQRGIELPSREELRHNVEETLEKRLPQRPSVSELKDQGILYGDPYERQELQIAQQKLKFRRKSEAVQNILSKRPEREKLKQMGLLKENDDDNKNNNNNNLLTNVDQSRNSDEHSLRTEIVRLHEVLRETNLMNTKLEKDNDSLRQTLHSLQKNSEENQLSQLDESHDTDNNNSNNNNNYNINDINNDNSLHELVTWAKRLSWPSSVSQIFPEDNNTNNENLELMQTLISTYRDHSKRERRNVEENEKTIQSLQQQISKLNSTNKKDNQNYQTSQTKDEIITGKMVALRAAHEEIERLRNQIRKIGKNQQILHQRLVNQTSKLSNKKSSSYVGWLFG